jgi:hypothetical protein
MKTTLLDRIKGLLSSDKDAYWWNHYTDEEKALRRMDVWELAKIINDAKVSNLVGTTEKIIVAEHMLNVRLAKIQSLPAWFAIFAGLLGVVGGALLNSSMQQPQEAVKCVCECKEASATQNPHNKSGDITSKSTATGNVHEEPINGNEKPERQPNTNN